MKPSEFLRTNCSEKLDKKINKVKNVDEWIDLLCEELDKSFIDKQELDKKLEQLKKKPRKVSSFDEHKAHLINEINKIIDNIEKELPYGLNMSIQDFKGELKKKIEEVRK